MGEREGARNWGRRITAYQIKKTADCVDAFGIGRSIVGEEHTILIPVSIGGP